MDKTTITSSAWATIPVSADTDSLVQFMEGGLWATGEQPATVFGFTAQPLEKVVIPAGTVVYARASGTSTATVISGIFGVPA